MVRRKFGTKHQIRKCIKEFHNIIGSSEEYWNIAIQSKRFKPIGNRITWFLNQIVGHREIVIDDGIVSSYVDSKNYNRAGVWTLAYSIDGQIIFSGSPDKSIFVWDVKSGKPISELKAHTNSIYWI